MKRRLIFLFVVFVFIFPGIALSYDNDFPQPCSAESNWGMALNAVFESIGAQPADRFEDPSVTISLSREDTDYAGKINQGFYFELPKSVKSKVTFVGKLSLYLTGQCSGDCGVTFKGYGQIMYNGVLTDAALFVCIQNQDPSLEYLANGWEWVGWNYPQMNAVMSWPSVSGPLSLHSYTQGWYIITDPNPIPSFQYDRGRVFVDVKWVITHKFSPNPNLWTTKFSGTIYAFSTRWLGSGLFNGKFTSEPLAVGANPQPFSGKWKGIWLSASEGSGSLSTTIIQSGSLVQGTLTASKSLFPANHPFQGDIDGSTINWVTTNHDGSYLVAEGELSAPTFMSGTYYVTQGGIGVIDTGTWTLTKQ